MDQKAIFSKFFLHDNVLKMMPLIQKLFFNKFKELNKHWEGCDKSEWKSIELSGLLKYLFNEVVHIVILGEEKPENVPKIQGMYFAIAIEHWIDELFTVLKNKMHILTLGFSTKYGLTKKARETNKLYNEIVISTDELL